MVRWVEHYSDLYSWQNIVTAAALDAIGCLPFMEELDAEPTVEELSSDGIPPDLIKHCKTTLLHEVLYQCWREEPYHRT